MAHLARAQVARASARQGDGHRRTRTAGAIGAQLSGVGRRVQRRLHRTALRESKWVMAGSQRPQEARLGTVLQPSPGSRETTPQPVVRPKQARWARKESRLDFTPGGLRLLPAQHTVFSESNL